MLFIKYESCLLNNKDNTFGIKSASDLCFLSYFSIESVQIDYMHSIML